jgi:hypothetical protein
MNFGRRLENQGIGNLACSGASKKSTCRLIRLLMPTYEVENFASPAQRRRLNVKPGITCLWQIFGRNEVRDFET